MLLPVGIKRGLSQELPSPLIPIPTGTGSKTGGIASQQTGGTTIARQFTGIGSTDGGLLRQLTGGGLSPTRQLGRENVPKKKYTAGTKPVVGVIGRPRPKSFVLRGKSADEGRGMFLVRQMTGDFE